MIEHMKMKAFTAVDQEKGDLAIEWIGDTERFGLVFGPTPEESSWFFVSTDGRSCSGLMPEKLVGIYARSGDAGEPEKGQSKRNEEIESLRLHRIAQKHEATCICDDCLLFLRLLEKDRSEKGQPDLDITNVFLRMTTFESYTLGQCPICDSLYAVNGPNNRDGILQARAAHLASSRHCSNEFKWTEKRYQRSIQEVRDLSEWHRENGKEE